MAVTLKRVNLCLSKQDVDMLEFLKPILHVDEKTIYRFALTKLFFDERSAVRRLEKLKENIENERNIPKTN